MITTNVGGLSELIPNEKVGYVVNPDSTEIADAMIKFYSLNKEKFKILHKLSISLTILKL